MYILTAVIGRDGETVSLSSLPTTSFLSSLSLSPTLAPSAGVKYWVGVAITIGGVTMATEGTSLAYPFLPQTR